MSDEVTPSEVRARGFDVVRRGYDRTAVDTYLSSLADEIERLAQKLEKRSSRELKVGLDDPESLALELESIGGEVASILEAARAAADGMRSRASSDVDDWRTATKAKTTKELSDASEQSQSMRAAAWNEGSSMLSSALAEARLLVDVAGEESLFIRAEAEREAIRLTGDARRDREESIRAVRMEAEQLIDGARKESEGILAATRQKAEQAQERARALEGRRSELLAELESTRASIGTLEQEIESRRTELETPDPVIDPVFESQPDYGSDSGSVRIVAGSRSVSLMPVDAEDMVADVVALRTGAVIDPITEPDGGEVETVAVIAPPTAPPSETAEIADQASALVDALQESQAGEMPSEAADAESGEAAPEVPPLAQSPEPVPDTTPQSDDATSADEIGSLFASLRDVAPATSRTPRMSAPVAETVPEPASDVQPETETPPPAAAAKPVPEPEPTASTNDENLISVKNAVLRDIKRTLVDLQNDALEHLRNDEGWSPTKPFTNRFKKPFEDLAVELTGSKSDGGAAKAFGADLHAAVSDAASTARDADAGGREIASSVSRVFRTWRADEAERRVTDVAMELSSSRV